MDGVITRPFFFLCPPALSKLPQMGRDEEDNKTQVESDSAGTPGEPDQVVVRIWVIH